PDEQRFDALRGRPELAAVPGSTESPPRVASRSWQGELPERRRRPRQAVTWSRLPSAVHELREEIAGVASGQLSAAGVRCAEPRHVPLPRTSPRPPTRFCASVAPPLPTKLLRQATIAAFTIAEFGSI